MKTKIILLILDKFLRTATINIIVNNHGEDLVEEMRIIISGLNNGKYINCNSIEYMIKKLYKNNKFDKVYLF